MNFIQNHEMFSASLDNEICIFCPTNGDYINLNKTGSEIWKLIEEKNNLESIFLSLQDKFSGDKEIIKDNIEEFLEGGIKSGFIDRVN